MTYIFAIPLGLLGQVKKKRNMLALVMSVKLSPLSFKPVKAISAWQGEKVPTPLTRNFTIKAGGRLIKQFFISKLTNVFQLR